MEKAVEFWLRGPVEGIPGLLQPVAHALLQARMEVQEWMEDFPDDLLWERPAGLASPGFHLQHLTGVLDRLLTYARGEALTAAQLDYLKAEGKPRESNGYLAVRQTSGVAPVHVISDTPPVQISDTPPGHEAGEMPGLTQALVQRFSEQVDKALTQLAATDVKTLEDKKGVGRAQIPSTVAGLLFHAAEHTQRHAGQLFVTARVIKDFRKI